jgi:hypothetical protein
MDDVRSIWHMDKALKLAFVIALAVSPASAQLAGVVSTHPLATGPVFPGWQQMQAWLDVGTCVTGNSTCTTSVRSTTAGTVWVIAVLIGNTTSVKINSASGGSATWTTCASNGCHSFNSGNDNVDLIYATNGAAGTTSVSVTLSAASAGYFFVYFTEWLPPSGATGVAVDTFGVNSDASCTTTCHGVGLTLSGPNDFVWEMTDTNASPCQTWNCFGGGFPWLFDVEGAGVQLNAGAGTLSTPTYNQTGAGGYATVSAIAFKATFTYSGDVFKLVNYSGTQGVNTQNCQPTCTVTIPSTTAGNLLFVGAADRNSQNISSISCAPTACTGGSAFTIPSGANSCQVTVTSTAFFQSCGYILSVPGGITSLSITMTSGSQTGFAVFEVSRNDAGTWALDTNASVQNAATLNPTGPTLTLSGGTAAKEVVFQGYFADGGASAMTRQIMPHVPGIGTGFFPGGDAGLGILLNTNLGDNAQYRYGSTNPTAMYAYAFK